MSLAPADDFGLRPYRQLAVRVLARALLDLSSSSGTRADRESARAFLAGSGMLLHWCHVAAIDPSRIVKHARGLDAPRPVSRSGETALG